MTHPSTSAQDRIDHYVLCTIDVLTVVVVLLIVLIIAGMLIFPAYAECLGSAREVRAAHGITAWSTWHMIDGQKCYMLGKRKEVVRNGQLVRPAAAGLSTDNARPRPIWPAGAVLPRPDPRMEPWVGEMEQPDVVDEVVRAVRMMRIWEGESERR
jgi:hypothetical protein